MVIKDQTLKGSSSDLQINPSDLSVFGVKKASFEDFLHLQKKVGEGEIEKIKRGLDNFNLSNDIEIGFGNLKTVFDNDNLFYVDNGMGFMGSNF
jgi:hypothetical protein